MSKTVPTPYMWAFQPQMGAAAGASQDYSTQFHWMSAGPQMINQVRHLRDERNRILEAHALLTETPRSIANPPSWPSTLLPQLGGSPVTVALPRNHALEHVMANNGLQIAGGNFPVNDKSKRNSVIGINTLRRLRSGTPLSGSASVSPRSVSKDQVTDLLPSLFSGKGVQLSEYVPNMGFAGTVRPDGTFQLAGGARAPVSGNDIYLTLQGSSSVPRSGGVGAQQFVKEFVPAVYYNPFSGPPDTFPDQFIPNFDIISNSVDGYD